MSPAEAAQLPWDVAAEIAKFLFLVATVLLGFAMLREITR